MCVCWGEGRGGLRGGDEGGEEDPRLYIVSLPFYSMLCYRKRLVGSGFTALRDNKSVYRKEREMTDDRITIDTTPPALTASIVGPCPTFIHINGTP